MQGGRLDLDELDKLILRELGQGSVRSFVWPDFRQSSRAIAKRLRVPSETVRSRIARWKRVGFVKGAVLWLNPDLFGLHTGMLSLDASPSIPKKEIIRRMSALDHILVVDTFVGNWVAMAFLYGS